MFVLIHWRDNIVTLKKISEKTNINYVEFDFRRGTVLSIFFYEWIKIYVLALERIWLLRYHIPTQRLVVQNLHTMLPKLSDIVPNTITNEFTLKNNRHFDAFFNPSPEYYLLPMHYQKISELSNSSVKNKTCSSLYLDSTQSVLVINRWLLN